MNVDEVAAENLFAAISILRVKSTPHTLDVCPRWILPTADEQELVIERMVEKSKISIFNPAKGRQNRIVIFFITHVMTSAVCEDRGERPRIFRA